MAVAAPRFRRLGGRRRRKAALPIQTGLVLFAAVLLAFVAFFNAHLKRLDGDETVGVFDFQLGEARRMQDILEENSSGDGSLRWKNPFSVDDMRRGAVLVPIIGILYMFTGLAIVCDDFFCAALEEITLKLDLSDDVAGATFMAAGAPPAPAVGPARRRGRCGRALPECRPRCLQQSVAVSRCLLRPASARLVPT